MLTKEITDTEWQLIETLRNYRKAYPNGSRMMQVEINNLIDELMDIGYQGEESEEEENEIEG